MRISLLNRPDETAPAIALPPTMLPHTATGSIGKASVVDILGRRTPILWFEAVAITEALTGVLAAVTTDPTQVVVPHWADTLVTSDGRIEVGSTHQAQVGLAALARTLHVLLGTGLVPPPLRLFIAKWIETPEPHPVQTFAEGLAYFARPDGPSLIRAVYERYRSMPEIPGATPVVMPDIEPPAPKPAARRKLPRWVALTATMVVCLVAATIAWRLLESAEDQPDNPLARVIADGHRVLQAAREQLAERFGVSIGSPAQPPATVTSTADVTTRPQGTRAIGPRIEIPTVSNPIASRSFDSAHIPYAITPSETATADAGAGVEVPAAPAPDASTDIVYTTANTDVEPPQMVYPHLPRVNTSGPDVNSMEVVVAEDGSVERVRLLSAARRMTDMMLLSGAKAWRFAPALRDGQPVRYRVTINWAATP